MTGIQALERKYFDKPMKPGQPAKREFEYIRHGTQTLIASFDISSGKIIRPLAKVFYDIMKDYSFFSNVFVGDR